LYQTHANQLEGQGKFKEAEKLYLAIGEPDFAINMYKMHKDYENMIRLVAAYYKDLLPETYSLIAKALESDARIKEAEYYYLEAKEWKSAVNMYCANNQYEEAFRVFLIDNVCADLFIFL
jgi:intraflagellar transport protein 172